MENANQVSVVTHSKQASCHARSLSITMIDVPSRTSQQQLPRFVPPMTARVVQKLPEGAEWLYELKLDGYRALLLKAGSRVQIRSRNNKDLTAAYSRVHAAGLRLQAETAALDGEIVAVDSIGRPSFQALQHPSAHPGRTVVFYAFDLLHLNGKDLTGIPLERRRANLPRVVGQSGVLLSEELRGNADRVIQAVRSLGLEGVVAKRRDSRYDAGQRNGAWVKLKLDRQQEFVIGGYRPGPHGVDTLLVGYYGDQKLRFAGKVRAGFTSHVRREVFDRLKTVRTAACPFIDLPSSKTSHWGGGVTPEQMKEIQWVSPELVAQVRFVEWTADGHLRHAAFLGLRRDKDPVDVRREP
jgi:bifunctional non-homologous end joining protein LigD